MEYHEFEGPDGAAIRVPNVELHRTCPACGGNGEPTSVSGLGLRIAFTCPEHGVHSVINPFEDRRAVHGQQGQPCSRGDCFSHQGPAAERPGQVTARPHEKDVDALVLVTGGDGNTFEIKVHECIIADCLQEEDTRAATHEQVDHLTTEIRHFVDEVLGSPAGNEWRAGA